MHLKFLTFFYISPTSLPTKIVSEYFFCGNIFEGFVLTFLKNQIYFDTKTLSIVNFFYSDFEID